MLRKVWKAAVAVALTRTVYERKLCLLVSGRASSSRGYSEGEESIRLHGKVA